MSFIKDNGTQFIIFSCNFSCVKIHMVKKLSHIFCPCAFNHRFGRLQRLFSLMTTKSMVESTRAEDMGQFLYHFDPDTKKKKITKRLEKLQLKMINSVPLNNNLLPKYPQFESK